MSYMRQRISLFFSAPKVRKRVRLAYWSIMILTFLSIIFASLYFYERFGPGVGQDTSVFRPEIRGMAMEFAQDRREQGRNDDFYYMINNLIENYPFLEMADRRGVSISALGDEHADNLAELARYALDYDFLLRFIYDNFISPFDSLGGISIDGVPHDFAPWLSAPYYFGLHDWRFNYGDRFYVPIREDNLTTEIIADGVAHMSIGTFLPKGYRQVDRRPFWHYNFEEEKQRLMDFYAQVEDFENLIIDIRGIGSGFGGYFLPLIIEPNINTNHNLNFFGFHTNGDFAMQISEAYRSWYNLGDLQPADSLAAPLPHANRADFAHLIHGFTIELNAQPSLPQAAFDGNIWLLTDSANFSGPNHMYLELAREAGFTIVYETAEDAEGWATGFTRLPYSGLAVSYNPIYFTDATGRAFEEFRMTPDHIVPPGIDSLETVMGLISQNTN